MLLANPGHAPRRVLQSDWPGHTPPVWLDLQDATETERSAAERATGLRVPGREELSEIENSSRLSVRGDVLTMSMPAVTRIREGHPTVSPLGFVLTPKHLITVRYADMPAFEAFAAAFADPDEPPPTSVGAFTGLLETIVDRLADVLEHVAANLTAVSHRVFRATSTGNRGARRQNQELQEVLSAIGRDGDLLSELRDSLLGLARIVPYVAEMAAAWIPAEIQPRLAVLSRDIHSLAEQERHLSEKTQFLLDATLGLINIQQNNVIRILTVASIVGIPPTLVASIYGMNFKGMPELDWAWGYPYGLSLIVLTALIPLVLFHRRGWI